MLESSKALRGVKDFSGRFVYANDEFLKNLQFKKSNVLGRYEVDVAQEALGESIGDAQKLAQQFSQEDQHVFRGGTFNAFHVLKMRDEIKFLFSNKYPLYEKTKIVGAAFCSREVINPTPRVLKHFMSMHNLGVYIPLTNEDSRNCL